MGRGRIEKKEVSQGNTDGTLEKAYSISRGVTVMQNTARGETADNGCCKTVVVLAV